MWLIVGSAILGACLGLYSRNRLVAPAVTAALTAVAHLGLTFAAAARADEAVSVGQVFAAASGLEGVNGYIAVGAGAAAAVIAGLLLSQVEKGRSNELYIPREGDFRPRRGPVRFLDGPPRRAEEREARLKLLLDL